MKYILLLITLVIQQVYCDILSSRRITNKRDCDKFVKIDEIEAGIKYLSVIKYMKNNIKKDFRNNSQIREDHSLMRKEFQIPLQKFEKELIKYKDIFLSHRQSKFINNTDYYDTNLQKAYAQFQEINFFENIFQDTLKFFNFEIVMEKKFDIYEIEGRLDKFYYDHKVESTLEILLRNFKFCHGYDYDIGLLQISSSNLLKDEYREYSNPQIQPNQINILQFMNNDVFNLKNFEQEVKEDDCPQKYSLIKGLKLEFEKLIELYHFKSVYQERKQAFNGFFDKMDIFLTDSDYMKLKNMQVQLNESMIKRYEIVEQIIQDKQIQILISPHHLSLYLISLDSFLGNYEHFYSNILKFYELQNHTKQFISLIEKKFDKLQNSLEFMTEYFDGFNYEMDYLKKGLEFFERDTKICNQQQCKQKVANMEQNIQKYYQAFELNKLINMGEHYDSIFSQLIENNKIISIIQDLENYQQLFKSNKKQHQVQVYPTHQDPEDVESVKAYENLIILQNKLVFLLNSFTKADELLNLDFNSYSANYKNLKNHLLNQKYYENYSQGKVEKQFNDLDNTQKQCSQTNKRNSNYNLPKDDDSNNEDYYWFARNLKPHHDENLLILPVNVDEFETEDIPNHQILSKQCKADIKGIVEDIIETSKILELINYNARGRNQFDNLISSALQIKVDFLKQAKELYFVMVKVNLQKKIRYFNPVENQTKDIQLQDLFNQLHNINDNLGYLELAFQKSKDLLTFNENDFNELQQYQGLVNQYFEHQPKMQLKDKEKELQDLFQEYKSCTGREFLQDFCQQYEEQNIQGGICQQNCYDKSNKLNVLQFDVSMDKQKPQKQNKKLKGQKKKIQSMKSMQKRQ